MLSAAVLTGALLIIVMLRRTPSGATAWHDAMTAARTAASQPPPDPPAWLRHLPGAMAAPHHAPSEGFILVGGVFGLGIFAEFIGAVFGSIAWGAAWLVVSGWTGRFALVPE